ncbi:MAG TPA: hypothetical protein VF043_11240 [Ktedonobacteraceae bacterium]
MADLTINSVSVPTAVVSGSTFSLDVSVTASADSVEDGSAYRLFIFVNSLLSGGLLVPPIVLRGHLGDTPWITANNIFSNPVTAGPSPDIYNVSAVLLEGHSGTDPDSVPSFGFAGPMVVV